MRRGLETARTRAFTTPSAPGSDRAITAEPALAPGPFGLLEPAGPRLGVAVVGHARLVLLPALAADRRGVRLGQGGGFYDRTLPLVGADVPLVVVLGDGELVEVLPTEPHDRRVGAALLPAGGVTMLGGIT